MSEQGSQPTEAQLREAYEAELSRISVEDMLLQTVVSLLNIGARRLGLVGEGDGGAGGQGPVDLEQVSDAIDAVRVLLPLLERRHPENLRPLRDALSQLQVAYARQAHPTGEQGQTAPQPAAEGEQAPAAAAPGEGQEAEQGPRPGPAQASGRLWIPGQ